MAGISDPFADCGTPAKIKLLCLGSPDSHQETLLDRTRSLHIEHVSPAKLMRSEISRGRPGHAVGEQQSLAALRRWFFARKPDAGFVLTDFPATLLQAQVLDEWLDARDESLDGVAAAPDAPAPVRQHYRTLGLLLETVHAA
jgi:adenylate kinase